MAYNLPDGCSQADIDARFDNLSAKAEDDLQTIDEWKAHLRGWMAWAKGRSLSDGFQMDEFIAGIENQLTDLAAQAKEIEADSQVPATVSHVIRPRLALVGAA